MSRRPVTPPRPRRERSRSPLTRQEEGLVDAYRRDAATRRGGRQARARTRGIHRGLLGVLHERIQRVLERLWDRAHRRVYEDRLQQIEVLIQGTSILCFRTLEISTSVAVLKFHLTLNRNLWWRPLLIRRWKGKSQRRLRRDLSSSRS